MMNNKYQREENTLYQLHIGSQGKLTNKFWISVSPDFSSGMTIKDAESEAERIRQAINNYDQAIELLAEARNQIEYLQNKFQQTGSGNNVLARIENFLETSN